MDHKALKSDLTYAIKKLVKEGKTLARESGALEYSMSEGHLVLVGDTFEALEALIFVKGLAYTPVKEVEDWVDPQGVPHHCEWFHHEAFGTPLLDIVSEQGQITKVDLYDFLDGLDFAEGNEKSEFYKVGVYIREKFTPVGVRTEKLLKPQFKPETGAMKLERRFIVYNKPMPGCKRGGPASIVEVECEIMHPPFLKEGEFTARIHKPEWLWEPTRVLRDGMLVEVVEPPVYMSHAVYHNINQAQVAVERQVRNTLEFEIRKGKREAYTDEELKARYAEIKEFRLP
jgi:hypothetical protein